MSRFWFRRKFTAAINRHFYWIVRLLLSGRIVRGKLIRLLLIRHYPFTRDPHGGVVVLIAELIARIYWNQWFRLVLALTFLLLYGIRTQICWSLHQFKVRSPANSRRYNFHIGLKPTKVNGIWLLINYLPFWQIWSDSLCKLVSKRCTVTIFHLALLASLSLSLFLFTHPSCILVTCTLQGQRTASAQWPKNPGAGEQSLSRLGDWSPYLKLSPATDKEYFTSSWTTNTSTWAVCCP